jgi:diguanylate cyclase (GGDEF)-like protein/PAS domain S-box-containing protein
MIFSARSRSVLVVAPIVMALLAFGATGLLHPHLISADLPLSVLIPVVLAVVAASAAAAARAAVRTRGPSRVYWTAAALGSLLSSTTVVGFLLAWPGWAVWGVPRVATVALVVGAVVRLSRTFPRGRREGVLLLLDGWLVAASVFVVCWSAVDASGSPFAEAPPAGRPALFWIPGDLIVAALATGAAIRAGRRSRAPMLLAALTTLIAVAVDTVWALTGDARLGGVLWIVQTLTFAGSAVIGGLDVWDHRTPAEDVPPLLRFPQWAMVPGLIAAVVLRADDVMVAAAVSLVLGLAVELALSGRQNHQLWRTLRSQAQQLDQLLSESRDAIVHVDARGFVRFANEAVADVLGFSPAEVLGRSGLSLVHPSDRVRVIKEITRLGGDDGRGGRINGRFQHADRTWRSLEATVTRRTGGEPGYTLSARDVSERVSLEDELRRLAGIDALTSLLNRPAFLTLLDKRLREGATTVLFVDLDGFKAINDMDGHAAGDRLLREVADTLHRELRGPDVAARLGGDEFAVLLGTERLDEARAVADRLVQRLRRMPSDPARRTAASVGVATGRGISAETLLGDADLAMYEAKARGGRRHVVFEPWMRERVTERARMSNALERACAGEGLLLDLQPIVAMADGTWVGFEALARWQDGPHRREPHEFLPVAEESGLIDPIGRWVLHRSLAWLARWPDPSSGLSVNVAGSQLATPGFGDWVHQQLAGHGVAADRLTLEISERTALGDLQRATAVLQPLRALGVRIALDDFGTGFSSLGHLAELPVDELKIDRRFVTGLGRRAQDDALVRAVCRLAGDLGLRVVAEGVETAAQAYALLEHGCQLGQGYRFHRPTAIADLVPPTRTSSPKLRVTGRPPAGSRSHV